MKTEQTLPNELVTANSEQLAVLKSNFPQCFDRQGKFILSKLQEILQANAVDVSRESYSLNWLGKSYARVLANEPIRTMLSEDYEHNQLEHNKNSHNLLIQGDNLEVLKHLKGAYTDKIKMIYIDPPYNKEKDFIYPDRFQDNLDTYLKYTGQLDEDGSANSSEKETLGRKHTAWLNMMYPRIQLAKQLLTQDGAIFISIDDSEVVSLREICNEIFGEENFVAQIVWQKSKKGDSKLVAIMHEYILCYTKNKNVAIESGIWRTKKEGVDEVLECYQDLVNEHDGNHEQIREEMMKWYKSLKASDPRKAHKHYNWSDDRGLYFAADFAGPDDGRESRPRHEIYHPTTGLPCKKPSTGWRWDEEKTEWALKQNPPRIHFGIDETTIPNREVVPHV